VSLGRGLAEDGDEVTLLASRDFASTVTGAGLRHAPFDISVREAAQSEVGRSWLGGHRTLVGEARALDRVLKVFGGPMATGLWQHTREADLVVSGILTADACASLTAARGQQHAVALLTPVLPSRHGASTATALRPHRDSALNALTGRLALAASYRLLRVPGEQVRERLGHPRTSPAWLRARLEEVPVLVGVSPTVVPAPSDQPRVHVTGYWPAYGWQLSQTQRERVETRVLAARSAGMPVVYFGFGSMTGVDPQGTAELFATAARHAGVHAIVGPGWSGLGSHLAEDAHLTIADELPHEWLFSRCDAVVHHGGAGTTGSAIRSGVPQVVVAHMGDQPYWARRAYELGVATRPLRRTGLRPRQLGRAVRRAVLAEGASERRDRAQALAQRVGAEHGVARARAALRS
jgi:UDP:flavonoid glycosyltransferase YjiC (YdhE family)